MADAQVEQVAKGLNPPMISERVEQAEGPSRELDLAICIALNTGRGTDPRNPGAPPYTSSLDAAMLLVPVGFRRIIDAFNSGTSEALLNRGSERKWHHAKAATPALALCAAALKARGL